MEQYTPCGSGADHRGQRLAGNSIGPLVRLLLCWGIWHYTQIPGCGEHRVDGAVVATGDAAESSRTACVHPYHHCVVTQNFTISGEQQCRGCGSGCRSNRQSDIGVPWANTDDQSWVCEMRSCLFFVLCNGVDSCTYIYTEYSTHCVV